MSSMHGWTTWNPSSIAVWEHLPSGLRCKLILENEQGQTVPLESWVPVEDYLPDDSGHSAVHLLVSAGNAQVEIECGGQGDVAACQILDIRGDHISAYWEVEGLRDGWLVVEEALDVALAPEGTPVPQDINAFLRDQRDAVHFSLPTGEGVLADSLDAMEATLAANTILLPNSDELITLSRHIAEQTGELTISNWKTFLTALGIAYADPDLAVANVRTALRHLAAGDMLAAEATPEGVRGNIANPPIASYAIWKLFQLTGDDDLLRESMPQLLRWHQWWETVRDANHNKILGWATAEESGMPGHPLYQEAAFDETSGTLKLDDVALSSLFVLDAVSLMRMALHFDELDLATRLEGEAREIADRMNLILWDQNLGTFHTVDWELRPANHQSALAFLSLLAGVPTGIRAHRLVSEHLQFEFNTPYLIPTLGDRDLAFAEQQPWRGRVSALLNFLICEGLRHYGEDVWAERITQSGLSLLRHSWNDQHQVFANYNAITGSGEDIAQDPMAPSATLFGALGIGLLIDMEPWNGMRVGNLSGAEIAVHGVKLRGDRYDLTSGPSGLAVRRNGKQWIETNRPAILRNVVAGEGELTLHAKVAGGGMLTVCYHGFAPKQQVTVKVNGRLVNTDMVSPTGIIEFSVELPVAPDSGGQGMDRVA